ncbi:MAG: DUF2007 domain-containing protein [Myxococcota bacterium]
MIRIYSSPTVALAHIVRDVLLGDGISAEVRNEHAISLAGGIPLDQCLAEVWVMPEQAERAAAVVERMMPSHGRGALSLARDGRGGELSEARPWRCACGEESPAHFELCWSCGAHAPEEA